MFKRLGVTLQLKGEWIDNMKYNENLYNLGYYTFDVKATGMKQITIAPQLSYTIKDITIYAVSDFPLYQYVTKRQVASQYFYTIGFAYRFLTYTEAGKK
ncbi:MAG: hypothetical protein EOP49_15585 [Sphingobacteriales bacterium]|nr:MAG: hypothetical protein EOP49_15585 [Sphingobacteriales bacterium]